jgi:hypothetical protein
LVFTTSSKTSAGTSSKRPKAVMAAHWATTSARPNRAIVTSNSSWTWSATAMSVACTTTSAAPNDRHSSATSFSASFERDASTRAALRLA